jgi:transcriptional regulator with XRE-family HTH domain
MTSEVMEARAGFAIVKRCIPRTPPPAPPIGTLLRDWRLRRRLSQLDLAGEAEVSTRHLSYLETGRAEPSREMVLRLADRLDVPLRERNRWLAAAAFAPMFAERRFDDPDLAAGRAAVELVLKAHEPWPGARRRPALDDGRAQRGRAGADRRLRRGAAQPPVNVLRLKPASRMASRRASPTCASGAPTCSPGSSARSPRAATPCSRRCTRS